IPEGGSRPKVRMTISLHPATRVRCRPIAESDLDGVAEFLTRGFPQTRRDYWTRGFARWRQLPPVAEMPRYGYLLDTGFGPGGVILMISSRRGDQVISDLCGWYVDPQWRNHAASLISQATKAKQVTYLNASPAPQSWRMLQSHGFSPYNFGRTASFAWPGRGTVSETIPDHLPEAQLLRDHRTMGWLSLTVEKDGVVSPFVLRPRRLERPRLPVMEVMFCR